MSFQQMTILGRLGKDPETRTSNGGKNVTKFSIASSEKRGGVEKTLWLNVTAFDKTGDLCAQYLKKGRQALIVGRLEIEDWTDKAGVKQRSVNLIADKVTFVSDGSARQSDSGSPPAPPASDGFIDDGDLPF